METGRWILNGNAITTSLKSWEDLEVYRFDGPATYRRQFTAGAAPAGKRVYLEIADLRDYARVTLNGEELGARSWQPYRWDVTGALKKGVNELEIQVNVLPEARRGLGLDPAPQVAAAGLAPARSVGTAQAPGTWPSTGILGAQMEAGGPKLSPLLRGCWARSGWWRIRAQEAKHGSLTP